MLGRYQRQLRPDAIWMLSVSALVAGFAVRPSVSTVSMDAHALAKTLAATLTTTARAIHLQVTRRYGELG